MREKKESKMPVQKNMGTADYRVERTREKRGEGGDYSKMLEIFMGIQACQPTRSRGPKTTRPTAKSMSIVIFDCSTHVLQSYPSIDTYIMCMKVD